MRLVFEELHGEKIIYSCFSVNTNSKKLCKSQGFKYYESKEKI